MPDSATEQHSRRRLAYLSAVFPVPSDALAGDEVRGMRLLGLDPMLFTIYPPPDDSAPADDVLIAEETHCLEPTPTARWIRLRAFILYLLYRPVQFIGMWWRLIASDTVYYWQLAWRALPWIAQLETSGVRHVHCHLATDGSAVAWMLHRLAGVPYSVSVHGRELDNRYLPERLHEARTVFAPDETAGRYLEREFPRAIRRIVSAPGIDPHAFQRREPYTERTPFRLVTAGRLSKEAGYEDLIDAVRILTDRSIEVDCVIIGDGHLRGDLERRIDDAKLFGRVLMPGLGSSDDLRRELEAASLFVMPCGTPRALMTAMAMELPAVVVDTPEHVDVLGPEAGRVVAEGDATALADMVEELAKLPTEELLGMGIEGRQRVRDRYDVTVHVSTMAEEFRRLGVHLDTPEA